MRRLIRRSVLTFAALAALTVSAALSAAEAQLPPTAFVTAGAGPVDLTFTGFTGSPFLFFLTDAAGTNTRSLLSVSDGMFSLDGGAPRPTSEFFGNNALTLGTFGAGVPLRFGFSYNGLTVFRAGILSVTGTTVAAEFFPVGDRRVEFRLSGIGSIANAICTPNAAVGGCIPVGSQVAPEPASMALLATGLLGVFAIRRRRAA